MLSGSSAGLLFTSDGARDLQAAVRSRAEQRGERVASESNRLVDRRQFGPGRLDAAFGLLHGRLRLETRVVPARHEIAHVAANPLGVGRDIATNQPLGEVDIRRGHGGRERKARGGLVGFACLRGGYRGAKRQAVLAPQVEVVAEICEARHEQVPLAVGRQPNALRDA